MAEGDKWPSRLMFEARCTPADNYRSFIDPLFRNQVNSASDCARTRRREGARAAPNREIQFEVAEELACQHRTA
jgi:hypothetical protein